MVGLIMVSPVFLRNAGLGITSKAIFLDIDGTLISHKGGPYGEDIEAIIKAREAGHRIFLNTGRGFHNIPRSLRDAPYIDGLSAGGGAHVIFDGKTIYHKWLPEGLLCAIAAQYLEKGKWCIMEGETAMYEINRDKAFDILLYRDDHYFTVSDKDDFLTRYRGALITKITMGSSVTGEEEAIFGETCQLCPLPGYAEATIRGESKAKAAQILIDAAGISRENTIAIGDSANDMPMIRFAGLGIAMGNACEELKEAAAAVTDGCDNGGVGKALRRFALV
jgi:Cof subfamily protein (haloacid dehalogenase superfamily)